MATTVQAGGVTHFEESTNSAIHPGHDDRSGIAFDEICRSRGNPADLLNYENRSGFAYGKRRALNATSEKTTSNSAVGSGTCWAAAKIPAVLPYCASQIGMRLGSVR